jgi:Mg2+ and Co2+ transporter CorA
MYYHSLHRLHQSLKNLISIFRRSILAEEMRKHSDLHSLQSTVDQYIMDAESVLSKVDQLLKHVQNEESQFRLQLNFSQNQILLLNTVLTIFACSVALGSYFTGIFGMNLDNSKYFEKQSYSFVAVFGSTFLLIFVMFRVTLVYFTSRGILPVIASSRGARSAGGGERVGVSDILVADVPDGDIMLERTVDKAAYLS